jgi:hypothetical protein
VPAPSSNAVSKVAAISASQFENHASAKTLGKRHWSCSRALFALGLVAAGASILAGCGGASMPPPGGGPIPGQNTMVTVLMTGTANDQLILFQMTITSITLADQAGNTATIFNNPNTTQIVEAIHLNGKSEPFVTVSVPQDVYTSATVTVGNCEFSNVTTSAGTLDFATYDEGVCGNGTGTTTVNLPSPITVSGDAVTMLFDLQVSQSFTLSGTPGNPTYTITPVFNLTAASLAAQPTNYQNGEETGLDGMVTAVSPTGTGFNLQIPDEQALNLNPGGISLTVDVNASTTFQGVSGLSALTVGTFVDMDGAVQQDGSLLASRIAVEDPSAIEAGIGPISAVFGSPETLSFLPIQQQGNIPGNAIGFGFPFQYTDSVFQVSGQFANVQNLPFTASFSASSLVAGQNVYIAANSLSFQGGVFSPAATITLMPQTINGTVTAVSNSNGFAVYTVSLAAYDLFPVLATQPLQPVTLTNPSTLIVYADTNTQMFTSQPIAVGSVVRFNGLIFVNDGALSMDCGEILDGVAE